MLGRNERVSWARTGVRGRGRQVVAEDLSKGVACEPRADWSEAKTWEGHGRCRGPGAGASQRPGGRARRPAGLQENERGSKTRSERGQGPEDARPRRN